MIIRCVTAVVLSVCAVRASAQTINIPQSSLVPLGDPGMISWNAGDVELEGTVTMKLIAEVTGTAVANGFFLDVQNDGFPAPPVGGATNDVLVFAPEAVPGAMVSIEVPAGCNIALFHDVFDETGGFLTGPNGILDDVGVNARDAYLNSNSTLNYTVEGHRQLVKYFKVFPAHTYSFTSQWGTVTQLGSGYTLFLFLDDDHSPNYDYDDMIVGVLAPPCSSNEDCDDGDDCTGAEFCEDGVCKPGVWVSCDDGLLCNGLEICVAGDCVDGTPPTCSDGIDCTTDSCVENVCVHVPVNENCPGDGLFCNGNESCDAQFGCVSAGNPCELNVFCDEDADVCRNCQIDDECADENPCTIGHACVDGTCQPGQPFDCTEFDTQCEVASCNPLALEANCNIFAPRPDGTECDDDSTCTSTDTCQLGICVGTSNYGLVSWSEFALCMTDPGTALGELCGCWDFHADESIDLRDAADFSNLLTAP